MTTVHVIFFNTTTIEVTIENRELCIEVLKFILDGIQHLKSELSIQTRGKWIFWGDDFRFAATQDRWELSEDAIGVLGRVSDSYNYHDTDRFVIHVSHLKTKDQIALFNEYKVV